MRAVGSNTVSFRQGAANKLFAVKGYPARKGYDLVTGVGTINGVHSRGAETYMFS